MSTALFIVLERKVRGIDGSSVSGKFLSKNLEWLDDVARKQTVRSWSELISVSPAVATAFHEDEGAEISELSLPPKQWFDAAVGLETSDALLQLTQSLRPGESGLLQDLR